jgi:predicted ATPase
VVVPWSSVFKDSTSDAEYLRINDWSKPISYFVGRNGAGKSRTIKQVAVSTSGRILSTDRLLGLMTATNYGWTMTPNMDQYKGVPIGDSERQQARSLVQSSGSAIDELYTLREEPDVWLRVAAFVQRALGRAVELRETAGFIDPYVRIGATEYSLLREEGHGLRELVVLLTAIYRQDWSLLIVDEPELHLHPSMVRTWLGELEKVCESSGRRAIIVTHEPSLIRPKEAEDLSSIWHFALGRGPLRLFDQIQNGTHERVSASLRRNPQLVSDLMFSPRPVLVEGDHDVAAFTVALARLHPAEVVAQTDFVDCGGYGGVSLWFEMADKLALDVRGVVDLDALFSDECQRTMDRRQEVQCRYRDRFGIEPPRTRSVLQSLSEAMGREGVASDPAARRDWLKVLPEDTPSGHRSKRDAVIDIWRDQGLWLHQQGTLEDVLGLEEKGAERASNAAQSSGEIDTVVNWFAYTLDPRGDVELLLSARVEAIAHRLMEAQRLSPGQTFSRPVGQTAETDAKLVLVEPLENGQHRITVQRPVEFRGYWLDFDRDTPASRLQLSKPVVPKP